jgi:hypothetical protein
MAHWIDKKYKSSKEISDKDMDILSTGKKRVVGENDKESPVFGGSSRDYIEMNIFTPNESFLESIRLGEVNKYIDQSGEFKINPGVILRRNGYFSGEYQIEFNFLREIAGSNKPVLVDDNNQIYTGEFDVLIDGRIVKQGTESEVRELDYKYYIEDISNNKKEIRLATLPIKNNRYKKEFSGLGEQSTVIYPTLEGLGAGTDVVKFDNPANNTSNEFRLNSNSNITLDKSLIGGEFIINDAFELMDLSDLGVENDGFSIGCHKVGKFAGDSIRLGDKKNGTGIQYFLENVFGDTGTYASYKGGETEMSKLATEIKGDSGVLFFGGAYTIGFRTIKRGGGFPIEINTTITDLDNIKYLEPELTAKIKGRDLVDTSRTFENTSKINFTGNGTKTLLPVPTNHETFGALYDVEFNLTFDINGTRRGITIYRPNLFCVLPTYKKKDDSRALETFVGQGINW